MKTTKKIVLPENEMPTSWYNIVADMKTKPMPYLNPKTKEILTEADLEPIFAKELIKQEFSTERWIEIPDEVRDLYRIYRPTPLVRASGLEKALDTPAKIYFKNESVSPVGSHKLNSAIPQAYYNKIEGIKHLTTETGAGQWGSSLSIACKHFGLDLRVFMVRCSYEQKPYRKAVMNTYGAKVFASPSDVTEIGRKMREQFPGTAGSLGMAISEAVEEALKDE
jgi:tryptophan synthase beta chain